ncbi:SigE family RNA polymerase sigma factor, partial [Pseudofrankia saprophytica]
MYLDDTESLRDTEDLSDTEDPHEADDSRIPGNPRASEHLPTPEHLRTPESQRTARAAFEAFFENHHRDLARLALLLTGNKEDAEDITADALTSAWMHWDRVQAAENPLAYVRRSVANLAASQIRRHVRQRNLLARVGRQPGTSTTSEPDVPQAMLLRWALDQLPHRKRQCVVLRYGLDLSEAETADWLGISVGTVKSQTSKAVGELERLLTAGGSGAGAPSDGGGRPQR